MELIYIIIATVLVSMVSLIGIFVVYGKVKMRASILKLIISLAAGALLAASFLDLLPAAIEGYGEAHPIFLTVLLSFLSFFILEKYFHWHHCRCDDCEPGSKQERKSIAYTNLIGDGIHNMTDGFLIATTFMIDVRLGIITTIAVMLHEIPQEISDFGILLYAGFSKAKALLANFIFALTAILGGVAFYFFGQAFEHLIPFMAAFAAGNFIYLSAADLIPELHHEKDPKNVLFQTTAMIVGVLAIYAVGMLFPHSH